MPTSEYIRLCKRTALIRPNVSFVLTNQPLTVVGFQKSERILCSNVPKDLCSSGRGGIDLDRQQMTQLDKSGSPEILYFPSRRWWWWSWSTVRGWRVGFFNFGSGRVRVLEKIIGSGRVWVRVRVLVSYIESIGYYRVLKFLIGYYPILSYSTLWVLG